MSSANIFLKLPTSTACLTDRKSFAKHTQQSAGGEVEKVDVGGHGGEAEPRAGQHRPDHLDTRGQQIEYSSTTLPLSSASPVCLSGSSQWDLQQNILNIVNRVNIRPVIGSQIPCLLDCGGEL